MNHLESFKNYSINFKNDLTSYCYDTQAKFNKYAPPANEIAVRILKATAIAVIPPTLIGIGVTLLEPTDPGTISSAMYALQWFGWTGTTLMVALDMAYAQIVAIENEWRANKLSEDQSKENVVLYCRSEEIFARHFSNQLDYLEKKYSKTHSISVIKAKDIACLNKAIKEIKETGRKISTLWISANRGPNSFILGSQNLNNIETMKEINFGELEKKANIVVSSGNLTPENRDDLDIVENIQSFVGPKKKCIAYENFHFQRHVDLQRAIYHSKKREIKGFKDWLVLLTNSDTIPLPPDPTFKRL